MENNRTNDNKDDHIGIKPIAIESELKTSYINYAMSVIVSRAIPDIRDGLKPVQRRILFAMKKGGYDFDRPYRKSARVIGDVMAQYHPHGDSAIYDAMVRMAQNFSVRELLIDGQGNFGSVDGDPAAAIRYTESRLSKLASHGLLADIDKNVVRFVNNYDESELEPTVLPAGYPNLLVNGAGGIAVGMASNIPPHNLGEVIDGCCLLIDDPEATVDDLMEHIKGPDFPTGCIVSSPNKIKVIYETGRGSVSIKSKYEVVNIKGKEVIQISEIPYQTNKSLLVQKIAELSRNNVVEGIARVVDESDRNGMMIGIYVKDRNDPNIIIGQLHRYTNLSTTFSCNMIAIKDKRPINFTLKQALQEFISFRISVIRKRTIFDLNMANKKAMDFLGYIVISQDIENVIKIIRGSNTYKDACQALLNLKWNISNLCENIELIIDPENHANYSLTPGQVKSIMEIRLQKLVKMERNEILTNLKQLLPVIKGYIEILNNKERLLEVLKEELATIKQNFNSPRKSEITHEEWAKLQDIDLVEERNLLMVFTNVGYVKSIPLENYKTQKRGGRGKASGTASIKDNDFISNMLICTTRQMILLMSSHGIVYKIYGYQTPIVTNDKSKGKHITSLISAKHENESIVSCLTFNKDDDNHYIVLVTSNGYIRKNKIEDFTHIPAGGKIAMKLNDDQTLIGCAVCENDAEILISLASGKCIRFKIQDIRVFIGRMSSGIRAIKMQNKNDVVIAMSIIKPDHKYVFTIAEDGIGKVSKIENYRITNRGGMGITAQNISRTNKGNVKLAGVFACYGNEEVMLITDKCRIVRCNVSDISITNRNTKGVCIVKLDKNEKIVKSRILSQDHIDGDQE